MRAWPRIMIIEKRLVDRVDVVLAQTRLADSPYYSINPSGRVPYLVRDDGVGMEESALICRYLDHLEGRPRVSLWSCSWYSSQLASAHLR
jgi:glutathione S-transferase